MPGEKWVLLCYCDRRQRLLLGHMVVDLTVCTPALGVCQVGPPLARSLLPLANGRNRVRARRWPCCGRSRCAHLGIVSSKHLHQIVCSSSRRCHRRRRSGGTSSLARPLACRELLLLLLLLQLLSRRALRVQSLWSNGLQRRSCLRWRRWWVVELLRWSWWWLPGHRHSRRRMRRWHQRWCEPTQCR